MECYVNQVTLAGGKFQRIIESGLGVKGDRFYLLSYSLGNMQYPILVFDKKGKMENFQPFSATVYGALTFFKGKIAIKANNVISGSVNYNETVN